MPAPFEFVVDDVFRIAERGTVVVGAMPASGEFKHGDTVEVLHDGEALLVTPASLEMHVRDGMIGLCLPPRDAPVEPGDLIRVRP